MLLMATIATTVQSSMAPSIVNEIKRYPTFRQVSAQKPDFTVAYVMAVLLGCVFGIVIAVYSESGSSAWALFNSVTANSSATVYPVPETTIAGKDFPLVSEAVKVDSPMPASHLTVAIYKSAALESTSLTPRISPEAHKHRETRKASAKTKFSVRFRNSLRHGTSEFHKAPVIVAMHEAAETAKTLVVGSTRPASFMIEGDVTVADYDALSGMIETHEGKTFTVAKATDESGALPWTDSLASVHYRCDQSGTCTLFHAGLSVSNVRIAS